MLDNAIVPVTQWCNVAGFRMEEDAEFGISEHGGYIRRHRDFSTVRVCKYVY